MSETNEFKFGDKSVANSYEDILVPVLFDPWGRQLLDDYPVWQGSRILDLAAGTGALTRLLAERIGSEGAIVALDINGEMLSVAREKLGESPLNITFIESPACPLDFPSNSLDVVVCQQGFQFFPDKPAAAKEIFRVLVPGGKAIISTWMSVSNCEYFGVICDTLDSIGEGEIADLMRIPFNTLGRRELMTFFQNAGFFKVSLNEKKIPFNIPGGISQAIEIAYATPIGPKLRELSEEKQQSFKDEMAKRLNELSEDGVTMGLLASNILEAEK